MPFEKYGMKWADDTADLTIHRYFYLTSPDPMQRYTHMKAGCQIMYPEVMPDGRRGYLWHDWTDERAKAWCGVYSDKAEQEDIRIIWLGAKACGKTSDSALFVVWDFTCDPLRTSIRVATNTKECLEQRTWREIKRLWQLYPEGTLPGNYVESEMSIISGAEGYIKGIAVKQGTIEQAIGSIKGAHGPRVRIICDELDQMPVGVVEAVENANAGCETFIFVGMGNPRKRYGNPLGDMATPISGDWNDCNVTTDRWLTKHGVCQFFDGRKSPGVKNPEKFGKFLVNQKQIDRTRKTQGEKSPVYWEQCIGFFAPEGMSNAVIDEPMILQFGLTEQPRIAESVNYGLFLDPSYSLGGDRCMVQPFAYAMAYCSPVQQEQAEVKTSGGQTAFQNVQVTTQVRPVVLLLPQEQIQLQLTEEMSLSDSIAAAMLEIVKKYRVKPRNIGIDCTASQGAIADVVERSIGRGVLRVTYSGSAGKLHLDAVVNDRLKRGQRAFANVRAEMYYAFRMFGRTGQIKGLDRETATELTHTEWKESSPPYQVEDKELVRKRIGMSPDKADVAVGALHVARYRMNLPYLSDIPDSVEGEDEGVTQQDDEEFAYKGEQDYASYTSDM